MILALQELEPVDVTGPIELNFSSTSCALGSCTSK
ncbi:class III lanthipeptide [Glycomyces tritici]